ncbi:MAG: hypothetical protein GEU97_15075 [Actinophytocola sp.]|nr:hypothetical protein [Actinophytocola sp.]
MITTRTGSVVHTRTTAAARKRRRRMMEMVSEQDRAELAQAAELLTHVIERHRSEDLRAVSIFNSALQDIRVGQRYLDADRKQADREHNNANQHD